MKKSVSALKHFLLTDTSLLIISLASGVTGVLFLLLLAIFAQPIADDFFYFTHQNIGNPFLFTADVYTDLNGRVAHAFLVSAMYAIFGVTAVKITPMLLIVLLAASYVWLCWGLLNKGNQRLLTSFVIGIPLTALTLLILPSTFDSLLWLTSSTIYVAAVTGIVSLAAWAITLYKAQRLNWQALALLFIVTALVQTFSEPASLFMIGTAFLVGVIGIVIKKSRMVRISLTLFIASVVGFLAVYFSPGSISRRLHSEGTPLSIDTFIAPLRHFDILVDIFLSWYIIPIVAISLAVSLLLSSRGLLVSKKEKIIASLTGLYLIITPVYVVYFVTQYAEQYTSLRAETVGVAVATLGCVILISTLILTLLRYLPKTKEALKIVAYLACIAAPLVLITLNLDTLRAEVLRTSLMKSRDAEILQQKENSTIKITPAPIILEQSDAIELAFKKDQVEWLEEYFKRYHAISKDIEIQTEQPAGYCLEQQAPAWRGVVNCSAMPQRERILNE